MVTSSVDSINKPRDDICIFNPCATEMETSRNQTESKSWISTEWIQFWFISVKMTDIQVDQRVIFIRRVK